MEPFLPLLLMFPIAIENRSEMKNDLSIDIPSIDIPTSNAGLSIEYCRIQTVDEARDFFGPISPEERAWRDEKYFSALANSPRSKLGIGEHDRAESYIFGNGIYPNADVKGHENHFPVSVKVVNIDELYISQYETMDLSAHADEFPWETGESEIYLHLTIKRLILSGGSTLKIQGNVLILNCDEVVSNNTDKNAATIELGGSESLQLRSVSRIQPSSRMAIHGQDGADGEPLRQESTALGVCIINGTDANKGEDGRDGTKGSCGYTGRNGSMLFLSDLRFGRITGFGIQGIRIKAGAGSGFPGGNGSDGGNGGDGGNGASGAVTAFGIIEGFPGGKGGRGGNGGNGGRGGNGGLCCDVFLSIPPGKTNVFQTEAMPSKGGDGGLGGNGGNGGFKGVNGALYPGESLASGSSRASDGVKGINGSKGKSREAPGINIYERANH